MIRWLWIPIILLILGCATMGVRPVCWQNAVYAAIVLENKGYETRIVYARSEELNMAHAQAQAKIDGKWQWINIVPIPDIEVNNIKDNGWKRADDWKDFQYFTINKVIEMWNK